MARKEYAIVVLSSSPPAPDAFNSPRYAAPPRRVAMPPSSPLVFSPPSSPKKHVSGALTSGSRAAPIPEKASRGFATVSSLVRSEHFVQHVDKDAIEIQQIQKQKDSHNSIEEATKRSVRRATKKPATEGEKPKPKPRVRKNKADKEIGNTKTALDPELRLPRTTRSPYFDNVEAQSATDDRTTEPAVDAPARTKLSKPRKPRAKKETPQSVLVDPKPKPSRTRVTKAKAATGAGKAIQEDIDNVSSHTAADNKQVSSTEPRLALTDVGEAQGASIWDVPQSPQSKQYASKQPRPKPLAEGLDLEEAVCRRRDWTPPRDTAGQSPSTLSTGKENRHSAHDARTGNFTHLISNFTYERSPTGKVVENAATSITATSAGVTKRRRVELVELPGIQSISRATSPEKGKAPKKKPRTITDLVTGQYATKDTETELNSVTSDFFSLRTGTTQVPLNDIAAPLNDALPKKPSRKRSKCKDNQESATTKSKPRARKTSTKSAARPTPVAEKLLSPASALTRMNQQEVLFGTSSQLALEESPTVVRHIQRAIKQSEQDERSLEPSSPGRSTRWPKLQRSKGKRGLWGESTRDGDGGLLENEENVYIPVPDRTQDLPLLMDVTREESNLPSEFVDIDDIAPPTPIAISSDLPTPPVSQPQQTAELISSTLLFDDIDDFDHSIPPSNQNVGSQDSFADIDDFQSTSLNITHQAHLSISEPPAPAAAIDSPSQRRGRPPKAKSAIPIIPVSAPPTYKKSSQTMPQQSSSTPPKGSSRFIDIEEILDSEDEVFEAFSPTPPRVRKLQDSPPLPLAFDSKPSASAKNKMDDTCIAPILRVQISQLEWANIKSSICAAITTHVRSIPPTTVPKEPSWHEKILIYDPIILEDFTAYLNSNTKLRTYRRATQKQIKAYNNILKMKGDAILGVEKDDQALVVEKELEVYMIRDWCQEISICCIHAKESRGRGSTRKGYY
ncbi:hypothetical protein OPT61_g4727 [Boeremia exigua]|uniref:Uncharacterized protein n=1 Tax=Boeremia exigua TaxID=749465 RepID=A0ACC2ID36_9PLEO|nr:hypothetical protein OPT61_g4727 [Boeremia exigua]